MEHSQRQGQRSRWRILAACFMALAGCGAPEEARVPVQGTVMLGDRPLTTGTVILRPDSSKGNFSRHEPRGQIDDQGRYQVYTSLVQSSLKPGAAVGWYKVGVLANEAANSKDPYALTKSLIPKKYNDPQQSGRSIEVIKDAPPGSFDLKLKPK
jgi:hypothetical protein